MASPSGTTDNGRENWFEDFFQGVSIRAWNALTPLEFTALELPLIRKLLPKRVRNANILDAPCGSGRTVVALAKEGHSVTGVDISVENLENARLTLENQKLNAELIEGDMRTLEAGTGFHLALCLGNSLGYFGADETLAYFKRISAALGPKGKFLIGTGMLAESLIPNLTEKDWYTADDITMLLENHYNVAESRMETEMTFLSPQGSETRYLHHYIFTFNEISRMLRQGGLELTDAYSNPQGDPYEFGDPAAYIIAQKL